MPGKQIDSGATTGYEVKLWAMAGTLRDSMDADEYMHFVLVLIFQKYIPDAFEERRAVVLAEREVETAEGRDEYTAENIFWFLVRDQRWQEEVLFIDAGKLGRMVDRTPRELAGKDITWIADTYHSWRADGEGNGYADVPGFCESASMADARKHCHVLTPLRCVGVEPQKDDDYPFEEKMRRLVLELREQQAEGARLDAAMTGNLDALQFGGRDL